jgi:hypothetical protein
MQKVQEPAKDLFSWDDTPPQSATASQPTGGNSFVLPQPPPAPAQPSSSPQAEGRSATQHETPTSSPITMTLPSIPPPGMSFIPALPSTVSPPLLEDLHPNPTLPSYHPPHQELQVPVPGPIVPSVHAVEPDFEQRLIELQEESLRTRDEAERPRHAAEQTLAAYRARAQHGGEAATGDADAPPPYAV